MGFFSDPNQENEWLAKAWGSQMELRAIQKRNGDETIRGRNAGEPKQRPSYGYMYVRLARTRLLFVMVPSGHVLSGLGSRVAAGSG